MSIQLSCIIKSFNKTLIAGQVDLEANFAFLNFYNFFHLLPPIQI